MPGAIPKTLYRGIRAVLTSFIPNEVYAENSSPSRFAAYRELQRVLCLRRCLPLRRCLFARRWRLQPVESFVPVHSGRSRRLPPALLVATCKLDFSFIAVIRQQPAEL